MKRVIALIALILFGFAPAVLAYVETEGMLEQLVRDISKNVTQYKNEVKPLLKEVSSLKDRIEKEKKKLKRTNDKESLIIKAEITRDVSRLIDTYQRYLDMTEEMLRDTLPKLQSLNDSLHTTIMGKAHQLLNDKKYYSTVDNLFSNLAGVALMLDDPELQNEIGEILGDMESLYAQTGDDQEFQKLRANIDQVIEGYSRILARVSVQRRKLEGKRARAMINIKLTKYILALNRLSDGADLMKELGKISEEIDKIEVPSVEVGKVLRGESIFYQDNRKRLQRYKDKGLGLR